MRPAAAQLFRAAVWASLHNASLVSESLEAVRADLERRVWLELGSRVTGWLPVVGGTQNRLFRLDLDDGPPLLAKVYYRDRWPRLAREFGVLSMLGRKVVRGVPRALLKSDEHQYAVYSFEAGRAKAAAELSLEDVRRIAELAAELHAVAPGADDGDVPLAVDAAIAPQQQIRVIRSRLGALLTFAARAEAYEEVREFVAEIDLGARVEALIDRAAGIIHDGDELNRSRWRINSGDFGAQNLLLTDDGQVTAVDWEAGGWDDPARLAIGFVAHAASEELTDEARRTFLSVYADRRVLSDVEIKQFESVGALLDLEWVAIYASAMTPEAVAGKEFANAEFDRHKYLNHAMDLVRQRLERATDGRGYSFSSREHL